MAAELIGRVKSRKTFRSYEVKWDSHDRCVYVSYAGWSLVGRASSASQAMSMAEAWLYNK